MPRAPGAPIALVCSLALMLTPTGCDRASSDRPASTAVSQATTLPTAQPAVERLCPEAGLCPEADLETQRVIECLDDGIASFWMRRGVDVAQQTFVYYAIPSSTPAGACARLLSLDSWFRCVDDDAIYLSGGLVERERDLFRVDVGLAMAFIVAEEFGMAIQGVQGQPGFDLPVSDSRRVTLTADCLAGMWADEQDRSRIDIEGLRTVIDTELSAYYRIPVPIATPDFDPVQAYGSVDDRLAAFDRGATSPDLAACSSS